MKKIISVVLLAAVLLSFFAVGASAASDAYKATWSLRASVANAASSGQAADRTNYLNNNNKTEYKGEDKTTVCVYPGQVVWVTMNLKTGSSYYAGSLSSHIFYNSNIFTSTNQSGNCYIWDKSGNYSSISKGFGAPFSKMVDSFKKNNYPSSWSEAQKNSCEFYSVLMMPDINVTRTTVANVNSDIVTVPIYVKSNAKVGATGSIFMTRDDQRTPENETGMFFLGTFAKGDLLTAESTFSDKISFDVSNAEIKFLVCSKNASGVTISKETLDMKYKSTETLSATVKGVSGAKAVWSSSNPEVAVVDDNGNVTSTGRGTAEITASYGSYSDTCQVNVNYSFGQWLIVILLFGWIWY